MSTLSELLGEIEPLPLTTPIGEGDDDMADVGDEPTSTRGVILGVVGLVLALAALAVIVIGAIRGGIGWVIVTAVLTVIGLVGRSS